MNVIRFLPKVLAFGCGAGVACLAIGLFEVTRAQVLAGPTMNLCFGSQGELRLVEPKMPCRPDERQVQVKQPDPKPKEEPQRNSRLAALAQRLSALEERERRGRLVPTRVVAPFEVIDRDKQRIFYVEEQNVTVYNKARRPVAWILADQSGGALQVQSADGAKSATLGALDKRANLLIKEQERERVDLGRRVNGGYGLKVFSKAGQIAAYIGQSDKGNGLAFVADKAGNRGAQALADDSKGAGYVAIMNAKGKEVASLYTDDNGAGRFELSDASGAGRVGAYVQTDGRGVVETGPRQYGAGVGIVGLVPSYILGNK